MQLFRPEVIEGRRQEWLGRIQLIRPVSLAVLTALVAVTAVAVATYLSLGEYTRKARVSGYLVPDRGVIRLVPPLIITLWFFDLVDPNVLGPAWHMGMNLLSTAYLGFTLYAFFRYLAYLDQSARPRRWLGQLGALAQLLVLPLAAFLFPVPYSSAMVLATLGRGPSQWVKTPRTRE